jgi:hypothetical protein
MRHQVTRITGAAGRLLMGLGPPLSRVQRVSAVFVGFCFFGISVSMGMAGVMEVLPSRSVVSFIACGVYASLAAGALWLAVRMVRTAIVNKPSAHR